MSTPFTNRDELNCGVPMSSLAWMIPSWLASFQQEAPTAALQLPLLRLGPQVAAMPLRLSRLLARVIFVWK